MKKALLYVESREVLAAAYQTGFGRDRRLLVHAVIVNPAREAIAVLCRRVSMHNLADRNASDHTAPPTCPACLVKLQQLRDLGTAAKEGD